MIFERSLHDNCLIAGQSPGLLLLNTGPGVRKMASWCRRCATLLSVNELFLNSTLASSCLLSAQDKYFYFDQIKFILVVIEAMVLYKLMDIDHCGEKPCDVPLFQIEQSCDTNLLWNLSMTVRVHESVCVSVCFRTLRTGFETFWNELSPYRDIFNFEKRHSYHSDCVQS